MNKNYIENLEVIARVGGNNISQQNLLILMKKYHMTDGELVELKEYCKLHGIMIFDENDNMNSDDGIKAAKQQVSRTVSTEDRIRLEKAKIISKHIMHIATVSAHKRVQERGWLCGTYASGVRRRLESYVLKKYSESEMDYIMKHLPEKNDEDICFNMRDVDNPQRIMRFNKELNEMIPSLHINRFFSDVFE